MNRKAFMLSALAGSAMLTASASADFIGASIITVATGQGTGSNLTTYQVAVSFDNPADSLNGVGGNAGMPAMEFLTDDPNGLFNSPDVPFDVNLYNPLAPALDSYLTLNFDTSAAFTPNFLSSMGGDAGGAIAGTNWSVADDGVFKAGGVAVGVGDAIIANFVVRDGYGIMLKGAVGWVNPGAADLTPFSVNNVAPGPTPGALALLGLAGLVGRRRRR